MNRMITEYVIELEETLERVREENRLLMMEIVSDNHELDDLNKDIDKLKEEVEEWIAKYEEMKSDYEGEIAELKEEIETLQENLLEAMPIGYRGFGGYDFEG